VTPYRQKAGKMPYRDEFREAERETWWSGPRVVLVALAILAVFYGLGFLATGGDLAIYRFWAPKRADAERQVFQNTQSFVQGKIQHIGQLCFEESRADEPLKSAFDSEIRDEALTVGVEKLPLDEQACVTRAKE
jgi:hypothetical protein